LEVKNLTEDAAMRRAHLFVALLLIACTAWLAGHPASASENLVPTRTVTGATVTSTADPPLRIDVAPGFTYAGATRFLLRGAVDAEQHLFVEADGAKTVQRMYWIQFEQFIPERAGSYDYDADTPLTVGGLPLHISTRRIIEPPAADSDRKQAYTLLERAGYTVPTPATRVRLIYLPTPDKRQEVMIIYFEAADTTAALTQEESEAILRRATEGLTLRPSASP